MGDRCNVRVRVLNNELDRFLKIINFCADEVVAESNPTTSTLDFEEVNYALCDELEKAAQAGIRFAGDHSEGGTYPRATFVSDGIRVWYAQENYEGAPVLVLSSDFKVDKRVLTKIKQVYTLWHNTMKEFDARDACFRRLFGRKAINGKETK